MIDCKREGGPGVSAGKRGRGRERKRKIKSKRESMRAGLGEEGSPN